MEPRTTPGEAAPLPERLVERMLLLFPALPAEEARISLLLYRLLAEAHPVATEDLAAAADRPTSVVEAMLDGWSGVHTDPSGAITGYWGLSLVAMGHRFRLGDRKLFTWCAWDSLFLPELLDAEARVVSTCPVTGRTLRLTVSPTGVTKAQPSGITMSFVTPEVEQARDDVVAHFCHLVHFFASEEAGREWAVQSPGAHLLTLPDAFALGRRKNAAQYGAELHPPSTPS